MSSPTLIERSIEPDAPILPVKIRKTKLVPESLQSVLVGGKRRLMADLEVTTLGGES